MKRLASAAVACFVAVLFAPPCAAQGCKHWAETLARSFFPRQVDEQGLRAFANLSPQEYFQVVSQNEEKGLADLVQSLPYQQKTWITYSTEARLRTALERFYRVGSDRARHSGGTGLGLAIVKHVLNAHKARLLIRSELGEGSEFVCVFPREREVSLQLRLIGGSANGDDRSQPSS